MSSMSARKKYLLIPGWILILAIVALGVIQSGNPANLVDASGFLFVLVGGIALAMISFSGAEIRRALRDAAGTPAKEADFRFSALLWEAAGRGFWIVGVLRSILHLMMFFCSIATVEYGTWQLIIKELSRSLVSALYGLLLAVICFISCWKLTGRPLSRPLAPTGMQGPMSINHPGRRFGVAFGYVLFFSLLISCFLKIPMPASLLIGLKPAFLVVLGGTIALMLFIGSKGIIPRRIGFRTRIIDCGSVLIHMHLLAFSVNTAYRKLMRSKRSFKLTCSCRSAQTPLALLFARAVAAATTLDALTSTDSACSTMRSSAGGDFSSASQTIRVHGNAGIVNRGSIGAPVPASRYSLYPKL